MRRARTEDEERGCSVPLLKMKKEEDSACYYRICRKKGMLRATTEDEERRGCGSLLQIMRMKRMRRNINGHMKKEEDAACHYTK